MTPTQAQPILSALDALGMQVASLRHQVLALVEQPPPKPAGAPCGHVDAVQTETRDGLIWVCPEGCPQ